MNKETMSKVNEIIQGNTVEDFTIAYYCMVNEGLTESQAVHYIVQNNNFLELKGESKEVEFLLLRSKANYTFNLQGFASRIVDFMEGVGFNFNKRIETTVFGHSSVHGNFSYRHNGDSFNIQIESINRD